MQSFGRLLALLFKEVSKEILLQTIISILPIGLGSMVFAGIIMTMAWLLSIPWPAIVIIGFLALVPAVFIIDRIFSWKNRTALKIQFCTFEGEPVDAPDAMFRSPSHDLKAYHVRGYFQLLNRGMKRQVLEGAYTTLEIKGKEMRRYDVKDFPVDDAIPRLGERLEPIEFWADHTVEDYVLNKAVGLKHEKAKVILVVETNKGVAKKTFRSLPDLMGI